MISFFCSSIKENGAKPSFQDGAFSVRSLQGYCIAGLLSSELRSTGYCGFGREVALCFCVVIQLAHLVSGSLCWIYKYRLLACSKLLAEICERCVVRGVCSL